MKNFIPITLFISLFFTFSAQAQNVIGGNINVINKDNFIIADLRANLYVRDSMNIHKPFLISYQDTLFWVKDSLISPNILLKIYEKEDIYIVNPRKWFVLDTIISDRYNNVNNQIDSSIIYFSHSFDGIGPSFGNSSSQCDYPANPIVNNGVVSFQMDCFDTDNDPIFYKLDTIFPTYQYSNNNDTTLYYDFPIAVNNITIDNSTGLFTWDKPTAVGDYLFKVVVEEWRIVGAAFSDFLFTIHIDDNILSALNQTKMEDITFSTFPNPTSDWLQVRLNVPTPRTIDLSIRNVVGQLLETQHFDNVMELDEKVRMGHLPKGVYLVSVTDGTSIATRRVVVQ